MKLFGFKFAEKVRTLLFLSVHFTNLVPKAKQCWLEKFDRLMAEVYVKLNGMIIIEKQCWLEKFDRLMVEVYVKLNGMIIIAGDFNININSDSGESTQRYKQSYTHFP